jgi:hypothetical protein
MFGPRLETIMVLVTFLDQTAPKKLALVVNRMD